MTKHEGFGPGTFGCHEALHEASLYAAWLDEFSEHSAIKANPEWKTRADKIAQEMNDLYQMIGAAHFEKNHSISASPSPSSPS